MATPSKQFLGYASEPGLVLRATSSLFGGPRLATHFSSMHTLGAASMHPQLQTLFAHSSATGWENV
jgi:hypothetical protein